MAPQDHKELTHFDLHAILKMQVSTLYYKLGILDNKETQIDVD